MTDATALFNTAWAESLEERKDRSPSYDLSEYTVTGRASAKYGGKKNLQWWLDEGPVMVDRWMQWRAETGWQFWDLDGVPAIELEMNFCLPGDIPIKAFIDRVFVLPTGELAVVDIKTGARMPDYPEQLGLYATGMEILWGVRPTWGYYWDAAKGTHGQPLNLDMYTADYLAALYREAIAGINAGSFLAKPANGCANWCGVARACAAVGGAEAHKYDPVLIGSKLTIAGETSE